MSVERRRLRLHAVRAVFHGPHAGVRPVLNDQVQLRLCDRDGRGREAEDRSLRDGRRHQLRRTRDFLLVQRVDGDGVLRPRRQSGKDGFLAGSERLPRLVAVGIGAEDVERTVSLVRIDEHADRVGRDIEQGNGVDVDGRGPDEHKIGHRARNREQQHEADDRGEPFVPLFPLPLLHAGLDWDVVILVVRLERVVIALRVAIHLAVDALDHVVEHLRVRREVLFEVLGH